MLRSIANLLFPPRCILCGSFLKKQETDLCRSCRLDAPEFSHSRISFSFIARWTAVWYYKDSVRRSLLRYKFYNHRSYAGAYGRLLAMRLTEQNMTGFEILTWVPVSRLRRFRRGYDQVELLARATAAELGVPAVRTLRKIRNTPPQSRLQDASRRRANVMGVYTVLSPDTIRGKRILLLDDIITTGSTASECAKTLLISGAKEVSAAAVAVASHDKPKNIM